MSMFRKRWSSRSRFASFTTPRRPRHPLLRVLLGVVGLAVLVGLLFISVFVGLAMLATGLAWRLLKQRNVPRAARARSTDGRTLDGAYRVVGKAQLPLVH